MKHKVYFGAASHVGNVRTVNEDKVLAKIGEDGQGEFGLFAVADGMGGLDAGDIASEMAIQHLIQWWDEDLPSLMQTTDEKDLLNSLKQAFFHINKNVFNHALLKKAKMGTTLSAVVALHGKYYWAHVGDSRIYMVSNNKLIQLSRDHSWVAEQVAIGQLDEEEARNHKRRNLLTRCLGVNEDVEVDGEWDQFLSGDLVIMCTDGFYNEAEIDATAQQAMEVKKDFQAFTSKKVEKVTLGPAKDNVTLLVARYGSEAFFSKLRRSLLG